MAKSLRANFILYPFLFGLYPVLALIAHNAREMEFVAGFRAIIVSIIFTFFLYVILLLLIRDPAKSALLTSILILLFYAYGHINLLARDWSIFGLTIGRHRVLLPVYFVFIIVATWLILRTKRDLSASIRFINAFALILLLFPLYQIAASQVVQYRADQIQAKNTNDKNHMIAPPNTTPPDVYYIILDSYPRGDFINQYLGSNNDAFLQELEDRDFFVAHCSQSNYSDTRFSLASTLNMEYLDGGKGLPEVALSGAVLDGMIRSNEVEQNFADLGYNIITFDSGYKWLRWELADHHLKPVQNSEYQLSSLGLNDFERLLLDTTAAKFLLDLPALLTSNRMAGINQILDNPRAAHRERVMYALEQLPQIPDNFPSPKFTYAHIIFPHPPFIVDAQGSPLQNSPANELSAYAEQIIYLNQRLLDIIDTILKKSNTPPIIILQGDHGPTIAYQEQGIDPAQRLGILNAYFLPPEPDQSGAMNIKPAESLYQDISPVNSFRLIFDAYFNGDYGLLEDLSILGRQSPYTRLDCTYSE
ncbi:MAG: hypothetical protein ACWGOY_01625 [Anaerolineales bacterium]